MKIPYGRQNIDQADIDAVAEVLRGDWLTGGPTVGEFENSLEQRLGARHSAVCSSGTAALHLIMLSIGVDADSVVVVPTLTFVASANAARYLGARIILADVDPETGLMEAHHIDEAVRRAGVARVDVVVSVHLAGQCADLEAIHITAADLGAIVVEDACHALGTTHQSNRGKHTIGDCTFSSAAAFSFHPVKTIAVGEGGAILTNDQDIDRRARLFRNHGMTRHPEDFSETDLAFDSSGTVNPWYYETVELGFNYRASDITCALGLSQLQKLSQFAEQRRMIAERYDDLFSDQAMALPLQRKRNCDPVLHLYVVRVDFDRLGIGRAKAMLALQDRGVGTQVHYIPLHLHSFYRASNDPSDFPGANAYYRRCLALPLHPGLTEAMQEQVADAVIDVLRAQ